MPFPLIAATQAPHGVAALVTAFDPGLAAHPMGPLIGLGLLALAFTRISARDAPAHPVRLAILQAAHAGICFSAADLAQATGVTRKTVSYHLHILERAGLVVRRAGLGRSLFAGAGKGRSASAAQRLLRNVNRRAVWVAAQARPGASVPELARTLRMRAGTAHFHVQVLCRAGMMEMVDVGGQRGVIAQPAAGASSPEAAAPADVPISA